MVFAIGYQEPENGEEFSGIVSDYRKSVAEVYFPWPGQPSGRAALGRTGGIPDWNAQSRLLANLHAIRSMGVKLDLLFNASCYGEKAISESLKNEICSILDYLETQDLLPEIVTTTSPFAARIIHRFFPEIELRASVNMRIDSTLAMEYLSDVFDSFYLRRDLQRDLSAAELFSRWCNAHGKKLCLLANSGCLRCCPAQSFHDNLVAHDAEIDAVRNVTGMEHHLCRRLFREKQNRVEFLRGSWIRPEDLHFYAPFFSVAKLATRQHTHPRMVIDAYVSGHFHGNLTDLTEPCFSPEFAPYAVLNDLFPDDWHTIAGRCAVNCRHCGRCEAVLAQVLRKLPEE